MTTKQPDWEAIERAYRAGVLSVREIAAAHEVSHTAINKRAKRDGWDRDLKAKIKAKADALVSRREVSTEVSSKQAETEREIIELNAEVIANIRMAHRGDISRSRRLTNKLLDELEGLTDNRDLFEELGELMRNPDDNGQDKRNDLYNKIIDLPGRTKTMKELAETLKTLVALERQAYDLDVKQGGSEEDTLSKLMDELSKDA
ncbi:hypothetical protein PAGU2196_11490 [Pseudomonas sp. PAGU 2196]|uniref:hypothetical protein n=1 Tax=Pseudomonas sp. PAGU 2196 TaxID=2793997 RepID=UPI001EDE7B46|nr:hypothetical protein [Pseudomonas sp. PAGU 2196]GHS80315.1 hypothetical protein PAGU2196_11490 [Pseudomonas sp. PAGU 2196]